MSNLNNGTIQLNRVTVRNQNLTLFYRSLGYPSLDHRYSFAAATDARLRVPPPYHPYMRGLRAKELRDEVPYAWPEPDFDESDGSDDEPEPVERRLRFRSEKTLPEMRDPADINRTAPPPSREESLSPPLPREGSPPPYGIGSEEPLPAAIRQRLDTTGDHSTSELSTWPSNDNADRSTRAMHPPAPARPSLPSTDSTSTPGPSTHPSNNNAVNAVGGMKPLPAPAQPALPTTIIGPRPAPPPPLAATPGETYAQSVVRTQRININDRSNYRPFTAQILQPIQNIANTINTLKMNKSGFPYRNQLKAIPQHFQQNNSCLRYNSTLWAWYGDTRLFTRQMWYYLASEGTGGQVPP